MGAILMTLLIGVVFFSIDYSRATSLKSTLQYAADAAAVTASMKLGGENRVVKTAFATAFRANLPEKHRDQPYSLRVSRDKKSLSVNMEARITTTTVQIVGLTEIALNVSAYATRPTPKVSTLARTAKDRTNDSQAKNQIKREIETGLAAARSAGIDMPAQLTDRDLDRAAEIMLRALSGR